jgi:hypothetical protein
MQEFIKISGREYNLIRCAQMPFYEFKRICPLSEVEAEKIHETLKILYYESARNVSATANSEVATVADSDESSEPEHSGDEIGDTGATAGPARKKRKR